MSCQCGAPPLPQKSESKEYASLDEAFKKHSSPRKNLTTFEKILVLAIIIILFLLYKGTKA